MFAPAASSTNLNNTHDNQQRIHVIAIGLVRGRVPVNGQNVL
jgi:hypothetical protein